jgi:uncharacterized repeat protein (TIGR01451 family)
MKRRFNRLSPVAAAAACAALFLLAETPVRAAGSQVLHGHVPAAVARLQPIGHLNGTNHLKLAIGLPLRDPQGLSRLLQQIYDPTSPNYHHYLTAAQFAERFGPTAADYQTLKAFAFSNHLAVTGTHPNRVLLDVEASVADIEKAFHTSIQVYRHPTEQRDFFAPDTEPSLDLNLPVLHISGLDNYVLPHPLSHKLPRARGRANPLGGGTNNAPLNGSGPDGSFLGYDFRNAYTPGVTLTGAGQNCALFEYDSYYPSDILAYEQQAGLPTNVTLVNVPIDGGIVGPPGGGVGEVSLDIEMIIAMAPGISTLFVYESPGGPADDVLSRMATDNSSKQISSSWVFGGDPTTDQIFQEFATQGQSFYQASGDSDAYVGPIAPPEDDPYITLVGGTELVMNGSGASYASESVWNTGYAPPGGAPQFNNYWGSGGGISTVWSIPSWQLGINMVTNLGSTTMRNIPDVALTADNIWVNAGDQTQDGIYGGTSCAAPLWNGFTALVNQQAGANGESTQGFINPAIYAIGKGASYASCFHDIVVGSNTWSNSPTMFFAVPGYDLCTGWGTPNGSNLINALAPLALTPVFAVVTNIISGGNGNGIIGFDGCYNLTIVLTNESFLHAATGIEATLFSTTLGAIVAQGTSAYPTLPPQGIAPNLTLFTLSTVPTFICGTPINLTLVVKCDQVVQTNYIQLPSGVVGPPVSFTNSTPISIPSDGVPANSSIVVSGLQSVGKITVSVYLQALYDFALTLQLISPNGTNVLLSQDNGNFNPNYGAGCGSTNLETTFDDAAAVPITAATPPYVGSFQPQQPLSVFHLLNGTNLNGTWTLQVLDEYAPDTAALECWSLNISPEVCLDGGGQCPGADLSLTMSASPSAVFVGSNVVYNLTASNAGPSTAQGVVIVQSLPTGFTYLNTSNYPVGVSQTGSNLNLVVGSLPVYGTATVSVITAVTAGALGGNASALVTSTASVGSPAPDPNPDNNTASATVLVSEPTADLAVTMTGSPSSVLQGALLTYTINVTNNGPFTANDVTLTTTLPANANFISATASQGTVSVNFNDAIAELNNIGLGTNVVVTIVISPTITGTIVASTVVALGASSGEVDPNTFNNSASVSTTVGPAADLGVTAFATPSPVVAGHNLGYIGTVSNAGPSPATGVVFSQTLPAGSTFVSSTLPGYAVSNNLINATITNLASGASVLFVNLVKSPTLASGVKSNVLVSTFSVFGQPGDPNTNNNVLTLTNVEEPPTVTIVAAGATVTSGSTNGSVGTNGTYSVQLFLQNVGNIPTTNLVATLQTNSGVTPSSGSQTYGMLEPEAAPTAGQYSFAASSTNGGAILAVLQLQDGTNNLGTVTFTFVMPVVQTFWNTSSISIPNQKYIPDPDSGPANPYPSAIVVSNVNGDVSTVTVTVSNLIHSFPNDIGMLLVGPTGANCVLMSAAADHSTLITPITVTFDQNAALVLPPEGEIVSGSYQPADYYESQYDTTETFSNSPVPVGPYNTNLAVFGGLSANGTWYLYIEDDTEGDAGAISNGWGLAFTTITPVNQVADLVATIVALTNQVILGNNITTLWYVTNNGPDAADVFVTNILPAGLTFFTNTLPPGATDNQNGPTNIYNLGSLNPGSGVIITNVVTANSGGLQTNTITAGSIALNGSPANSTASVVTMVNLPPADLAVGPISVAPNPVVVNSNLVYTLWVTNNGPSNALNVVGTFTNSSGFRVVGTNLSQGNCVINTGSVQFNLGTISNGSSAEVVLTNTALSAGIMTSGWSVTNTLGVDANLSNNSATVQVTVTLPLAVITNGPATLLSQGSPPLNGAINSGQTNTVAFTLVNTGTAATTNLVATLLANSGIRPVTTSASYGIIAAGRGSASQSFTFVGSGSSGATITAELSLQDKGNTNLGPVFYSFMIPMTQSFSNSGTITIPYIGPGSPYPSSIEVSGLTNGLTNLLVSKVTATLNGFTHSWPHDVEAVLVGPAGQEVALMEHTGTFYSVTNLVLTFNDAALQSLPLNSTLFSGTFLATEYTPFDSFPTIGAVPANSTNLAVFNGENPNGIWSLYVYDDTEGNDGVITSGWSLGLTAVSPLNQATSLSASRMAGKLLQLNVIGSLGQSYGIQISSNLVSWTTITTNTGSFTFTDSLTNAPQRFYRAIQLSQ